MGLTLRAMQTGFRIPNGLMMGYPGIILILSSIALNLSLKSFTPSLLISVDDYALRFSLLVSCISSYVQTYDPTKDPYISPSLIKDEVNETLKPFLRTSPNFRP